MFNQIFTTLFACLLCLFILNLDAQDCFDDIQNEDEVAVDCGGVSCPPCVFSPYQATIQRVWRSNRASFSNPYFNTRNIETDLTGDRMVWSASSQVNGYYNVYASQTVGQNPPTVIHERQSGDGSLANAFVDISADGSLLVFSYGDRIYTCNFDGSSKKIIADGIVYNGSNYDLSIYSPPRFSGGESSNPYEVYFMQTQFGGNVGIITEVAGLYKVPLIEDSNPTQVFNAIDVAQLYGADGLDYNPNDGIFGPEVSENNVLLFGTRVYNLDGRSDLWTFEFPNTFNQVTTYGPASGAFSESEGLMDLSGNGEVVAWYNTKDKVYHQKNVITGGEQTYNLFSDDNTAEITTNYKGNHLFVRGSATDPYNTAFIANGRIHYPLANSKWGNSTTHEVYSLVMSRLNDRLIYYSSDEGNIWMTQFGDATGEFPEITDIIGMQNFVLHSYYDGPPYGEMKLAVQGANGPVNDVDFVELDHANEIVGVMNSAGTNILSDDGSTYGDEAIDNIFTTNYLWPDFQATQDGIDTLTLRINLREDNAITSYDFYPYFILDNPITSTDVVDEKGKYYLNIIPTIAFDHINLECNFSKASDYKVINQQGQIVKTFSHNNNLQNRLLNIENLPNGGYIIQTSNREETLVQRFIKM